MATPEPTARRTALRWAWPLGTAVTALAATAALRLRDPHVTGSWGLCPWKHLTGWDCPGCGGLRAINDLTHGDVAAASSSNLVVVLLIPVAIGAWVLWLDRTRTRRPVPSVPGWAWGIGLVLLAGFTALRNIPAGSWLAA